MWKRKKIDAKLKLKIYLINVAYMPTNEEALKKYAGGGYEIVFIHGTCHFPMIEKPEEFNRSMQNVIEKIGGK